VLATGAPSLGIPPPPVLPYASGPPSLTVTSSPPLAMTMVQPPVPVPVMTTVVPYVAPYYKPKPERN
jgi:hypothetical protein